MSGELFWVNTGRFTAAWLLPAFIGWQIGSWFLRRKRNKYDKNNNGNNSYSINTMANN